LRGTLRHLFQPSVMEAYLNACGVLIKDFGAFAQKLSAQVRAAGYQLAQKLGRPVEYLRSNQRSKEQIAKQIAQRDKIQVCAAPSTALVSKNSLAKPSPAGCGSFVRTASSARSQKLTAMF
jgi:hypothetical protein